MQPAKCNLLLTPSRHEQVRGRRSKSHARVVPCEKGVRADGSGPGGYHLTKGKSRKVFWKTLSVPRGVSTVRHWEGTNSTGYANSEFIRVFADPSGTQRLQILPVPRAWDNLAHRGNTRLTRPSLPAGACARARARRGEGGRGTEGGPLHSGGTAARELCPASGLPPRFKPHSSPLLLRCASQISDRSTLPLMHHFARLSSSPHQETGACLAGTGSRARGSQARPPVYFFFLGLPLAPRPSLLSAY